MLPTLTPAMPRRRTENSLTNANEVTLWTNLIKSCTRNYFFPRTEQPVVKGMDTVSFQAWKSFHFTHSKYILSLKLRIGGSRETNIHATVICLKEGQLLLWMRHTVDSLICSILVCDDRYTTFLFERTVYSLASRWNLCFNCQLYQGLITCSQRSKKNFISFAWIAWKSYFCTNNEFFVGNFWVWMKKWKKL